MYLGSCEKAAESGASGGCFRGPFRPPQTCGPRCSFYVLVPSFEGFEPLRRSVIPGILPPLPPILLQGTYFGSYPSLRI